MSTNRYDDFTIAYNVFNRGFLVERIIDGLTGMNGANVWFFFDNCSDDSVAKFLAHRARLPGCRGFVNRGYDYFETLTNNWVLRRCRTRFCLLCQDDMVLRGPEILDQARRVHQEVGHVGVLGFKDGYDMAVADRYENFVSSPFSTSKSRGKSLVPGEYADRTYINRGPWCISRETIKEVGYLDPTFYPLFWDDNDFSMRCHARGRRNVVAYADVECRPEWGATRGGSKIPCKDIYCVNRHIFARRWRMPSPDQDRGRLLRGYASKATMVLRGLLSEVAGRRFRVLEI